jgi:hypothetical protein
MAIVGGCQAQEPEDLPLHGRQSCHEHRIAVLDSGGLSEALAAGGLTVLIASRSSLAQANCQQLFIRLLSRIHG